MNPGRDDSFGLDIMRERAQRAGGELSVNGRPGGGTRVSVNIGTDLRTGKQEGSPRDASRTARR